MFNIKKLIKLIFLNKNKTMSKELKINVPEGFEIDKDNSSYDLIIFKPINNEEDKYKAMSDFLFKMFNNTVVKLTGEKELTYFRLDGYDVNKPNSNVYLFRQDLKNGILLVRYQLIWQVFKERFGFNHNEIRDFIRDWVETNLNWKGLTPINENNL